MNDDKQPDYSDVAIDMQQQMAKHFKWPMPRRPPNSGPANQRAPWAGKQGRAGRRSRGGRGGSGHVKKPVDNMGMLG